MKLLNEKLLPDCRRMYPNENYVFQQDEAISVPLRTFWKTILQVSLKKINGLSNLRFAIPWITMYETHFQRKFTAEGRRLFLRIGTKNAIKQNRREISQDEVPKTILSWKKRLPAICDESGGHIDHLFR